MSITLRQIEAFLAVAEEAHFGRAAERMYTSQSVVSQEIRRLERSLGTSLFERTTRTVRLSPAGAAVRADAQSVRDAAERFVDRATRLAADRASRLRVAASPSAADGILPMVLRRAEQDLPGLQVEEVDVDTGEVAAALLHHECDIGLGRFVDPPPGYRVTTVATEPVYAALSSRHAQADKPHVDLAAMGDLPLLLWSRERNPTYYDRLLAICTERGLAPLLLVSPPKIVGGRAYLIADGRAFGLVPESTARRLGGDITAVPLARPASLPMSVVWMEEDPRSTVNDFVELVQHVGDELGTVSAAVATA